MPRRFQLKDTPASSGVTRLLQVSDELSKQNYQLFRQGGVYRGTLRLDIDVAAGQTFEVFTLCHSWQLKQAWRHACMAYYNSTVDERKALVHKAQWEDFRVGLGNYVTTNHQIVSSRYSTPTTSSPLTGGEFLLSQVVDSNNVERVFYVDVSGPSSYDILAEYANVYKTVETPVQTAIAYGDLEDDIDDLSAENLTDNQNNPPYERTVDDQFPFVKVATLGRNADGSQNLSTGVMDIPFGFVLIRLSAAENDTSKLSFEAQAGKYKGVSFESYGTPKMKGSEYKVV